MYMYKYMFIRMIPCVPTHEQCATECGGAEVRGSEQIWPERPSRALWRHRSRPERAFRALWRHQGKPWRPFRAL